MRFQRKSLQRVGGVIASAMLLSACSSLGQITGQSESVDYKSTVTGDPLSIPPDLTQANRNTHYRAPEGVARLSDYQNASQKAAAERATNQVLPQTPGVNVMRDGQLRWLVVSESPQTLFPKLVEFWGEQGFTIQSQDARAGLIQTDWAENRAKIPEGWLRSALGSVLDQVFDSGERDRFTTRIERHGERTEVYVSHQHMEQTPTADGTTFKWVFGKEDPGLNAAMLARLMVYLGEDQQHAAEQIRAAQPDATAVQATSSVGADGASLVVDEPFDRAWRRVGVALDSARFTVEDLNRDQGNYDIRYLDTDTGVEVKQPTIFGRLFGSRNTAEPLHLRVHLETQGSGTLVTVQDTQGQQLTDGTARRIVSVLESNLKQVQ